MKKPKPLAIDCAISSAAGDFVKKRGVVARTAHLADSGSIEPLKKLLASALDPEGAEDLKVSRQLLREIDACAVPQEDDRDQAERMLDAVNSTIEVISDQLQTIELEIRMLNLRKKALKRRSAILERLRGSLADYSSRNKDL